MGVDFSPTFCYISYAVLGAHGGIAQLARAFGSYPECPRFKSRCRYQNRRSVPLRLLYGPLVKWLRHRPFTAVTWVRVPYGSPKDKPHFGGACLLPVWDSNHVRSRRGRLHEPVRTPVNSLILFSCLPQRKTKCSRVPYGCACVCQWQVRAAPRPARRRGVLSGSPDQDQEIDTMCRSPVSFL